MQASRFALAALLLGLAAPIQARAEAQPAAPPAAAPAADAASAKAAAGPDEVVLKSGAVYHGWVKGQDDRRVYLLTSSGKVTELPLSVVAAVNRGAGPAAPEPAMAAAPAALARPAEAAAPADALPYVQFGLGAGLSSSGMSLVYLPLQFGDDLRLELELGLVSARLDDVDPALGSLSSEERHVGLGVFGCQRFAPWGRGYYGARVYSLKASAGDLSVTGWGIALAAGGEWTPNRHVALGVEAQYHFEGVSYPTVSGATGSATANYLQSVAFIRVFLTR